MKPAAFDYVAVTNVEEALAALASSEEARVLAGGQSLVPMMNLRLARPSLLVDLNPARELDEVAVHADGVHLGALCRHRHLELDPVVKKAVPLLSAAAALIAHPQIRSRGTLGGSLAHADPAAELGAALLALGGSVVVAGPEGRRSIAASTFFTGFFSTAMEPGEVLVEAVVPARPAREQVAFVEAAPRAGDFALAGLALCLTRTPEGACEAASLAGCGLASAPVDLSDAASVLLGEDALTDALLLELARRVGAAVEPAGDVHATAEDRTELAQLLAVDAVRQAWNGPARAADKEEAA